LDEVFVWTEQLEVAKLNIVLYAVGLPIASTGDCVTEKLNLQRVHVVRENHPVFPNTLRNNFS
jgi:hypothetical protein